VVLEARERIGDDWKLKDEFQIDISTLNFRREGMRERAPRSKNTHGSAVDSPILSRKHDGSACETVSNYHKFVCPI